MNLYLRILKYLKPYWLSLLGSIICIFFFTIFSSASLVSIIPFLDTIFTEQQVEVVHQPQLREAPTGQNNQQSSPIKRSEKALKEKVYQFFKGADRQTTLERLCFFIIILVFLRGLFDYLQAYFMATVEQGIIRDIRNDLYSQINILSLNFFHRTRTGQIISRITNDVTLVNGGVSASFVTLLKNPMLLFVLLGIAIYLSWQLTLIALVVAPFSMALIGWIGLKLRKESTISQEKMADLTSVLQETISGVRVVKAFAMEKFEIKKFSGETQRYYKSLLRITRTRNLASPLADFLGTSIGVGILWFGGKQVLKGQMLTPEEFIGFLVIVFSMMQPVKELSSVNTRIQEAIAAAQRIFHVLDIQPDIKNPENPVRLEGLKEKVEFRNTTFSYGKRNFILKDISLEVKKGEILAIVGPSGAGKSTLVDLIPRFYDPQKGAILIDGIDIRNITLTNLRLLMGIVTQETILFNDTVRNNIAYGVEEKTNKDVIEAAKIANAHDFISQLPDDYETNIGERGVTLSGGQRQRLAIARAVLKNPPILILDEATSALDTESEILVQQAIERLMKNRTSFVIAHRLSTILNADRIIVIDKGRIVQQGKHNELAKEKGLYQKLYNMQFRL